MFISRVFKVNQLKRITTNGIKYFNTKTHLSTNIDRDVNELDPNLKVNPNMSKSLNVFLDELFFMSKTISEGKSSVQELVKEPEFQRHCERIVDSISTISDNKLNNLLHSMLVLGLDPNTKVLKYLENEMIWRTRHLPLKALLKCLSYHIRYQETDLQKKVVNELILKIQSNLVEILDDDDVILMFRLSKCFSSECNEQMEKIAIDMITDNKKPTSFKSSSLCYLLVLLSQLNRRTKPLIRAVINQLTSLKPEAIHCSPSHLINMISALNVLNFPDNELLQKSCDLLCNKNFINKVSSSSKRDLLVAMSQLNWSHPTLLDAFVDSIVDDINSFSREDLVLFVTTCARLNYRSHYMNGIISNHIIPNVKQDDVESYSWLLYVWSLAILGSAPLEHISSVMDNEFYEKLLKNTDYYESIMIKMKILNIKAVAEIEMKQKINCPNNLIIDFERPKRHKEFEIFQTSLIETLNSFMPKGKYMETNITTPFGFSIDAEFITNASNNPLPIQDFGIFGADLKQETKPIPDGYKRFALLSFGYSDTVISTAGLIGVHELTICLLKNLGYSVITVKQNSLPLKMSYIKKIQYLQRLVSKIFEEY